MNDMHKALLEAAELEEIADIPIYDDAINYALNYMSANNPALLKHSTGVAEIAFIVAQGLGIPNRYVSQIIRCGLMHDFGKVDMPASLLSGPIPSSGTEDGALYRLHPVRGYEYLMEFRLLPESFVARDHHLYDREPYPEGTQANKQYAWMTEIIILADALEAFKPDKADPIAHRENLDYVRARFGRSLAPQILDLLGHVFRIRMGEYWKN